MKKTLFTIFLLGCLVVAQSGVAQSIEIVTNNYSGKVKTESREIGFFLFDGNTATLLEESRPNLKKLRKFMKKNKNLMIELAGYTNGCSGGRRKSEALSKERAQVIKDYLVDRNIKSSRIRVEGYGEKKMLYRRPRNNEEEKLNRRVEVIVLSY